MRSSSFSPFFIALSKNPSETEVGPFFEGDARNSLKITNEHIRKRADPSHSDPSRLHCSAFEIPSRVTPAGSAVLRQFGVRIDGGDR
jgi:hypothetical protein